MNGTTYREAREALGLTQRELADFLGVHEQTISKRERGVEAIGVEAIRALRDLLRQRGQTMAIESDTPLLTPGEARAILEAARDREGSDADVRGPYALWALHSDDVTDVFIVYTVALDPPDPPTFKIERVRSDGPGKVDADELENLYEQAEEDFAAFVWMRSRISRNWSSLIGSERVTPTRSASAFVITRPSAAASA